MKREGRGRKRYILDGTTFRQIFLEELGMHLLAQSTQDR
jgi:hypothetical protein